MAEDKKIFNTETKGLLQRYMDEMRKAQTNIPNPEIEMAVKVKKSYTDWITIFDQLIKVNWHKTFNVISLLVADQKELLFFNICF